MPHSSLRPHVSRRRLVLLALSLAVLVVLVSPAILVAPDLVAPAQRAAVAASAMPDAEAATLPPSPASVPTALPPSPTLPPTAAPTQPAPSSAALTPEIPAAPVAPTLAPLLRPSTTPLPRRWVQLNTANFRLFALPGSDGERDLPRLAEVAEQSYMLAARYVTPTEPVSITVYLVPRVFWQGGVAYGAGGEILISHLDRNYVSVEAWSYLIHEVTHALGATVLPSDAEVGGLLGEGVAVLSAGGHYGIEPVDAWASALLEEQRAQPLCELRYDFYVGQHEIAYIQAASFVRFLIHTYGLETFREMYERQEPQRGGHSLDLAGFCAEDNARIAGPLHLTNQELEQAWHDWLRTHPPTETERAELTLQIRYFDTMRRYEERLDTPARMLPPPARDWTDTHWEAMARPASGPTAAAFETMFVAAHDALRDGDTDRASALLETIEEGLATDRLADLPIGDDYVTIAVLFDQLGYDLIRLDLAGDTGVALVELPGGLLYQARLVPADSAWRIITWEAYTPVVLSPPG